MGRGPVAGGFTPPSRIEALFNRVLGALLGLGVGPGHMQLLEVRGRRSGRAIETPVDPLLHDGRTYLVAPRGTTQWVKNVRASGTLALRRGRVRREFDAEEVPESERAGLLDAYLSAYRTEVQRYFDVKAGAASEAFARIAPAHPVFLLRPREAGET